MKTTAASASTHTSRRARSEIPVRQTVLPGGKIRFSVQIEVGGVALEAMLDTGSVGLRLLPTAVPLEALELTGAQGVYGYANGVQLRGPLADAYVKFSDAPTVQGRCTIHASDSLTCAPHRPRCPASLIRDAGYVMFGDGIPGYGYRAILGCGLRAGGVPSPLSILGEGEWIVELPQPDALVAGRIIVNPSDVELRDFKLFALEPQEVAIGSGIAKGWSDAIPGSLRETASGRIFTSPIALDTGASAFALITSDEEHLKPWVRGTPATLQFGEAADSSASLEFKIDVNPGASVKTSKPVGEQWEGIRTSMLPYYSYCVYYDSRQGRIGLKRR